MNRPPFFFTLPLVLLACAPERPAPLEPPAAPLPPSLLTARLSREAAARSTPVLPVERVHAALIGGGIGLLRWKQVLASPLGARFCMAGVTTSGLALSVCEFTDAASAARGLLRSRATFDRLIPHRDLQRNGATLLTLAPPGAGPPFPAQTQQLREIFAAL
jgi:hypothetical protein